MIRWVAVLVAGLALLTGCTTSIAGTGRAGTPAVGTSAVAAASSSSSTPSPSATSPSPSPTPTLSASGLLDLVLPVPAGATASTDPWAANSTPTVEQFADVQYAAADAPAAAASLAAAGVQAIAHRGWYVPQGASADDILLSFASADQARDWASRSAASTAAAPDYTAVAPVAGMKGYAATAPNSDGDVVTVFYGVVGGVGVIVDYWTPGAYRADEAQAWLPAQLARLR